MNITVNDFSRLDCCEKTENGYKVVVQKMLGGFHVAVSKTNANGITSDFYQSTFSDNLNAVSKFVNKIIL